MRPGCDRLVAARLTFDPVGCAVWLDPPAEGGEPVQQVCSIHAATLTVPLGWTVTDRRFESVGAPAPADPRSDGPHLRAVEDSRPVAPLERVAREPVPVEPVPVEAVPVEPDAVEQVASGERERMASPPAPIPAEPSDATPEEPGGEVSPAVVVRRRRTDRQRPGLLDRAFGWTGPQRSVLTQPGADTADTTGDDEAEPEDVASPTEQDT